MPDPLLYLRAMAAAAIVSALFVLAITGLRRPASAMRVNSAAVLGTGLGLAAGCGVMSLRFAWIPLNGLDRLFMIVIPAAIGIELIAGIPRVPCWGAWLMRIGLAIVIPRILLHGSVYLNGSGSNPISGLFVAVLVGYSALLLAVWGLLFCLSERLPGVSIPFALALTTECAGLSIMLAGYIKGGAASFPLAATLVGTTLGTRLIMIRGCPPAMIGIGVVGLFGISFIGHFFGRLSTGSMLVVLLAPLLCWVSETPLLRHRKPWLVGTIQLLLVAIPLAAVLALAKHEFDQKMAPLL